MIKRRATLSHLLVLQFVLTVGANGGIRAPGKYAGVVVFDRWDACILYSGIYLMYVSQETKAGLRKYAGQPVLIDAIDVFQPINPGDGLIGKFDYLGPAPEDTHEGAPADVRLTAFMRSPDGTAPVLCIKISNAGKERVELLRSELGMTLLARGEPWRSPFPYHYGPSVAVLTRQCFEIWDSKTVWRGAGIAYGESFTWSVGAADTLPHIISLEPGRLANIDISFHLPAGQYDFLCGYGGGVHESKCLSSNLVAFDVDASGKARLARLVDRMIDQP
ncbi:MAG: hypothetical protein AB1714_30475 [Acidobacteriota bacterium]